MNVSPIIRRTLADTATLAEESGLSRSYIKHMSKPGKPQPAGRGARQKLASALRKRALKMLEDAHALGMVDGDCPDCLPYGMCATCGRSANGRRSVARLVVEPSNLDAEALLGSIRREVETLPVAADRGARLRYVLHSHGFVLLATDYDGAVIL